MWKGGRVKSQEQLASGSHMVKKCTSDWDVRQLLNSEIVC